jgi:glutathionylspermidine synthase
MHTYHDKRSRFYSKLKNFWADLYGEEYALYDIASVNNAEIEEIRLVSLRVGSIFFKVCKLLRKVPDQTLLEMGFPEETLSFVRLETLEAESVIARLDLIPSQNGYKCIEINADTPTFIKELFFVNGEVSKEFALKDPNEKMDVLLGETVRESIFQSSSVKDPYIVFTAHEDNIEDRETVLFLQELSGISSKFIPLHKLYIQKGIGLFDEDGVKIDILYRQTFPIENLISDEDSDGNKIGLWLLELVENGKLAIINPPSAFLLQNKAVQAVIWGLHTENHPYFTTEEHEWIENYFLPTYLEPDFFIEKRLPFVKKPAFGREGDTVEIYNWNGQLLLADVQQSYKEYLPVYQQFIEQPAVRFESEMGKQEGRLLVGSFLLNGKPAAVGYRIGGAITNNLSYYFPAGMKEGE